MSSAAILEFLDSVASANQELQSFMLYRHGHVVAEGYWAPYRADSVKMMFSLTKSVAVCGVAYALDEGRFKCSDTVISFFPNELPDKVDDKLAAMTVHDLLTMRTGHAAEVSGAVWRQISSSWVAEFFKIPIVHEPGTTLVYSSAASFMLSAIVTKTTGEKLRDYLEHRLFLPLGIRGLRWDEGPGGINPGSSGLSWKISDALKLGILYAHEGKWDGRQVISADWIREATRVQAEGAEGQYGYQWWIGESGSYYAIGKFGQILVVFPEQDAVLAITAALDATQRDGSKLLLPPIWKAFPAAFSAPRMDNATTASTHLQEKTRALRLLPPLEASSSVLVERVSGRNYAMTDNEDTVTTIQLQFEADRCIFRLADHRGTHEVEAGLRDWLAGITSITVNKLHHQYQSDRMQVIAGGRWLDSRTFEMVWLFVESPFRDTVVCRFDGDCLTYDRRVNVNSSAVSRPTLRGLAT